jgi:competence protein ComEC
VRLVWLAVVWLIGIALGLGGGSARWGLLLAWCGLVALAFALLLPRAWRPLLFLAIAMVCGGLGTWRASLVQHPIAELPTGTITAVRGVVRDWPIRGSGADTAIIAVEAARVGDRWQGGSALMRAELPLAPSVGRGDRVEVYGVYRPTATIDLISFREFLARQGIHGQFRGYSSRVVAVGARGTLSSWRAAQLAALEERLRRHIPGAEAALTTGILLGDDRLLPTTTRKAFTDTGTAHIMALSGWNVALVAGLCALIGKGFGRRRSILWLGASALAIWVFVLFVGASPTLIRAAIMGSLYLLAEATGRRGDALSALALAAILMTAIEPGTLFDIGFQLSCAATIGLIIGSAPLLKLLQHAHLPVLVAAPTAATVAAEMATLPLSLHHFGRFSLMTLPTNLLVEWPVPLIMFGGMATAIAAWLPGPLADLCGLLTWLPARAMLLIVEYIGAVPWATRSLPAPNWPTVAALYVACALALTISARSTSLRQHARVVALSGHPALIPVVGGAFGGLILWVCLTLLIN